MRNSSKKYTHLNDDGRLLYVYYNSQNSAAKRSIEYKLSFDEYCSLLGQAEITSSKVGVKKYHLSRVGDKGIYEIGNCRFIHYKVNHAEQKKVSIGPNVSIGLFKYYETHTGHFLGKKHSEEAKLKIGTANKIQSSGRRNSQFGTCWITDGIKNAKVKKGSKLPLNWRLGRTIST